MSRNSMEKISADRRISSALSSSGGRCFCLAHHSIAGASASIAAKKSRRARTADSRPNDRRHNPPPPPIRRESPPADSFPPPSASVRQTRQSVFRWNHFALSLSRLTLSSHSFASTACRWRTSALARRSPPWPGEDARRPPPAPLPASTGSATARAPTAESTKTTAAKSAATATAESAATESPAATAHVIQQHSP
jgi:hypothetical protein